MRRFLIISFFTLALIVGATGATPVAHAATCVPGYLENTDGVSGINPDGNECTVGVSSGASSNSSGSTSCPTDQTLDFQTGNCVSVSANGTVTQGAPPVDPAAQSAANQTPTVNQGSSNTAFNPVMTAIAGLFAWLVGVAALTLDYAVYYTVVNMGEYIHKLTAIGVTWRILRDIGNIMLIFGFLAIGISVILNTERIGYGKKMLPMLLVAAVFLNFSLFFSEAIIDTGNLFATEFYKQINGGNLPKTNASGAILGSDGTPMINGKEGVSSKLMSQLGLAKIYDVQNNSATLAKDAPWYIGFLAIILFIVTAFVMFSLAFILIARFIWLVFLIILAPIGFAGLAVPQLKHKAGQWWSSLFQQTITAPVLLLLLYVALAVITDAQFLTGIGGGTGGDVTGFVDNKNLAGFASYMMSFSIAIGLMLAVTISAKSLSAFGADKATALAGKLSFGATALGMRTTAGWGANRLAKYARSTRLARIPLVGTGIVKGLDKVATGSFDVRGATSVAGLKEAGTPQKGGYRADLKGRVESRTKYAKDLTGRELKEEEKVDQKVLQNNIKATEKRLADAQVNQRAAVTAGRDTQLIDEEIAREKEMLAQHKKNLDKLESVTDAGSQRKYAENLELNLGEKSFFNKYINFAANTEATKTIRKEAKKSVDDKTLDSLKKALKKAGGGEDDAPVPVAPGGGAPANPNPH